MWFYYLVAYFFIYSFLGWCLEVTYQGVAKGQLINRGFLNGPVCPIYGFGMVGVLTLLSPVIDNKWLLFFGGIIIATVIELFGGWALDKLFHMRWWDYSEEPFNLNGYICLKFCILWGIAVVFAVRYFHAIVYKLVAHVPFYLGVFILIVCAIAMICDLIVTYKTVIGITRDIKEIERVAKVLHEISDNLTQKVGKTAIEAAEKSDELKESVAEMSDGFKESVAGISDEFKENVMDFSDDLREGFSGIKGNMKEELLEFSRSVYRKSDAFKVEFIEFGKNISKRSDEFKNEMSDVRTEFTKALNSKYESLTKRVMANSKRMSRAFPKWHISGQTKRIEDYIKNMRFTFKK
ncbi:MAG: hypothetical protein K6G88_12375 [Lachnospiraceae bacterium]|nr:hypothetical protein [Lachnospiraceae bacterium]